VQIKAEIVIKWIDDNLPPLTWRIIALDIIKLLIQNKIMPAKIDGATYFNAEIVDAIKKVVKDKYNKELPNFNR
jgi:hypothetical protein